MSFFDRMLSTQLKETPSYWSTLTSVQQLDEIIEESKSRPVIIFKHSTRCGISYNIKYNLEEYWDFEEQDLKFYYLATMFQLWNYPLIFLFYRHVQSPHFKHPCPIHFISVVKRFAHFPPSITPPQVKTGSRRRMESNPSKQSTNERTLVSVKV